jgi:hypothetical protein
MSGQRATRQTTVLLVWMLAWGCGGTGKGEVESDVLEGVVEETSFPLPTVDTEAGTVAWSTKEGDEELALVSVEYLEHRQLSTGWFVLEAVLVDGERKTLVSSKEAQDEQAKSYGRLMRKDLVDRQFFQ